MFSLSTGVKLQFSKVWCPASVKKNKNKIYRSWTHKNETYMDKCCLNCNSPFMMAPIPVPNHD